MCAPVHKTPRKVPSRTSRRRLPLVQSPSRERLVSFLRVLLLEPDLSSTEPHCRCASYILHVEALFLAFCPLDSVLALPPSTRLGRTHLQSSPQLHLFRLPLSPFPLLLFKTHLYDVDRATDVLYHEKVDHHSIWSWKIEVRLFTTFYTHVQSNRIDRFQNFSDHSRDELHWNLYFYYAQVGYYAYLKQMERHLSSKHSHSYYRQLYPDTPAP